uniref:Polysaccharide biosynthesis domain-containing protein n=1 Tax=Chrysolophus pictus TaxID=9089 RepID=A0A8C3PXN8_CHRPC
MLTKVEEQIYGEFRKAFGGLRVDVLDPEELKSEPAKEPPGFSSLPLRSLATGRATTASSTTAPGSSGGTANKPCYSCTQSRSVCDPPPIHPPPSTQSTGGGSVETIEVYLQSQCLHCMQQTPLQVNQQSAHAEKDPTRNRRRKEGRRTNQKKKEKKGKRNEKGKRRRGGGVG